MRNLSVLEVYRMRGPAILKMWGWEGDKTCGAFELPSPIDREVLRVIVSSECGWDHVSVSRQSRCPNWPEMEHVKRLFFKDDETAMQLHVPPDQHRNHHPHCLHLWRPNDGREIPRPPGIFVAPGDDDSGDPGIAAVVARAR